MKIGLVHDLYSPIEPGSVGGEDNLVDLEAKLLEEEGHEVKKIVRIFSGTQRKLVHFMVTSTGRGLNPLRIQDIRNLEIIHTNNLSLISGYSWLQKSTTPIVSSFHNYRPLCPIAIAWRDGSICFDCHDKSPFKSITHGCGNKVGFLGAIRRGIVQKGEPEINHPSHLIFTSQKMAQAYLSRNPSNYYDVLPNPSRLKLMLDNKSAFSADRKGEGFLFAGRLTREKGIMELLDRWPDEEFLTIAGNGELQEQVKEFCRLKPNLSFHGTFSPNDPYFYSNFEALLFPSSWLEGSPLVVIEAISMGVPVIATEISSASELVRQSQCGVVISQDFSKIELRNALQEVRVNRESYRANGINSGNNEFSPKKWVTSLEAIFTKVLGTHSLQY